MPRIDTPYLLCNLINFVNVHHPLLCCLHIKICHLVYIKIEESKLTPEGMVSTQLTAQYALLQYSKKTYRE
jgi:predicted metal-binding transcription factor (methanogenesis marker protein 9)